MPSPSGDAYFELGGREVDVALFDSNYGPGFGAECPRCGTWGLVLHQNGSFRVDQGRLTVDQPIACRKRGCDLVIAIEDGEAREVSGAENR